jgi:hypothetical protein
MPWTIILRPREMDTFRACRRAWDFGARIRQNYVPRKPPQVFDFDKAVHDGLAVYYYPAMDDWSRAIVRPVAMQGFIRSMQTGRALYERSRPLTPDQERDYDEHLELGKAVLNGYFHWVAGVDDVESILSDHDVWVPVLDPDGDTPESELARPDLRPVRYLGRIDALVSDTNDEYWLVEHRVVRGGFHAIEELMDDPLGLTHIWGLEFAYPQLWVSGIIYNELLVDAFHNRVGEDVVSDEEIVEIDKRHMQGARHMHTRRGPRDPLAYPEEMEAPKSAAPRDIEYDEVVDQIGNEAFRRTVIRRGRHGVRKAGQRLSADAIQMVMEEPEIYPTEDNQVCATCVFVEPCVAMSSGQDISGIMAAGFRVRDEAESLEEESMRWSAARKGASASMSGKALRNQSGRIVDRMPGAPK